jgi:hypothetical protein
MGTAAVQAIPLTSAYTAPATASKGSTMPHVIQKLRSGDEACKGKPLVYRRGLAVLSLAMLAAIAPARAQQTPPKDLLKRVAAQGSLFESEREHYTYRQTFHFFEMDRRGATAGDYLEVRDVLFSPNAERTEEIIKGPVDRLKRIRMTKEDFRDIRDMQPFVLTEDTLWLYSTKYQGEEIVNGRRCYVYRIQPRQVLDGQRLLDGQVWVDQESLQVVQSAGQPLPQLYRVEDSNLFARFLTVYEPIDGKYWFPVKTVADDTLPFSSGAIRVRYEIDFESYKRFSSDSTITFDTATPTEP